MKETSLFEINPSLLNVIVKYYNRTEESINEDVKILKEWLNTQPHLPKVFDDKCIQNFFLLSKCSIERTKQRLDMYCTIRNLIPDMFENVNPKYPNIKEIMNIAYWIALPKLMQDKHRVMVFKMRNKELIDKMEPVNVYGYIINLQELRMKEDIIFGDIVIMDMEGINMNYLMKLTPTMLMKGVAIFGKVFSIPTKKIYLINISSFINNLMGVLKSTLKPKLFQRISTHEGSSILLKDFPKEIIPRDYGGEEKSLEELQELQKQKFLEYQDIFDNLDRLKVDENLRPEKLRNDDILGFYGNFRKLDVD